MMFVNLNSSSAPQWDLGSVPGVWEQHRRPGQYPESRAQALHCLQGRVRGQRDGSARRQIQVHGPVSLLVQRTQGPWIQGVCHHVTDQLFNRSSFFVYMVLKLFLLCLRVQDVSRAKLAAMLPEAVVTPSTPAQKDEADRKPEYPKPDTNQMIPFQPRHLARMYPCAARTLPSINLAAHQWNPVCRLLLITLKY